MLPTSAFQVMRRQCFLSGRSAAGSSRTQHHVRSTAPPPVSSCGTRHGSSVIYTAERAEMALHPRIGLSNQWSRAHTYSGVGPSLLYLPSALPRGCSDRGSVVVATNTRRNLSSSPDGFDPYATQHTAEDAERAEGMIRDFIQRRLTSNRKDNDVRKDYMNGVLNSWRILSERDPKYSKRADDFLQYAQNACAQDPALSPRAKSYGMVIDAYAKSGNPAKAEETLQRMLDLWKAGNKKLRPSTLLYNSVIDAWAKSGKKVAPRRAKALLDLMDRLSQQGFEAVRPNTITFSAVINAHAKSGEMEAAQRAEQILNRMEELRKEKGYGDVSPNTITFNAVIDAHAKGSDKGAAQRAEKILNHMIQLFEDGREECRPDVQSFTAVIDAWAKSKDREAPQRAEKIIQLMKNLSKKGYKDVEPNTITYNSLINVYAMSPIPNKAEKALEFVKWMESEAERANVCVAPTSTSYGAVLKACAWSHGRGIDTTKVLRIALQTFEKVRNSPDLYLSQAMYTSSFSTVGNKAKGEQRAKITREIFRLCCQDGFLDDVFLDMLRRRLPKKLFVDLVGSNAPTLSANDLPREWSRNGRRR